MTTLPSPPTPTSTVVEVGTPPTLPAATLPATGGGALVLVAVFVTLFGSLAAMAGRRP